LCRFTNPSATEADLLNLQREILREVLSYTPGHPSFRGGLPADDDGGGDDDDDDDDDGGPSGSGNAGRGPPTANTGTAMPRPALTSSSSRT